MADEMNEKVRQSIDIDIFVLYLWWNINSKDHDKEITFHAGRSPDHLFPLSP